MKSYNPISGLYDGDEYPYTYVTTQQPAPPKTNALAQNNAVVPAQVAPTDIEAQKEVLRKAKWIPYVLIGLVSLMVFPQLKRSLKQIMR